MLTITRQFDEASKRTTVVILGDPEPIEQFTMELLLHSGIPHIEWNPDVITLRDDAGRVIRYRATGAPVDGCVTAELIEV